MEAKLKRKANVLEKTEMLVVIEIWKENVEALRSTTRNSHIFKKMCDKLRHHGVELTPVELKNRINNLTRKYRNERNAMGPSGGSPSTWDYFEIIHNFLHSYKQNSTREMMDEVIGTDVEYGEAEYLEEEDDQHDQSLTPSTSSPIPSSSGGARSSAPKIKKRNVQEKILQLAEKENAIMEAYLEHAKSTDLEIVGLMKENNDLMRKMIDKM